MMIVQNNITNKQQNLTKKIINFDIIDTTKEPIKNNLMSKITDDIPTDEKITPTENKTIIQKPKAKPFVCPVPKKEYTDMWLYNVGQNTSLSDITYIPKNLEKISGTYSAKINICLTHDTLENLKMMLIDAKTDGYTIKVTSAFRTFSYQTGLLQTATDNGNLDANLSIAKAGYSEHQLGTAVDLSGLSINFMGADNAFNDTVEARWLEENASEYGFIESYPENKTGITGYIYEPWHYRYVGIDNAKIIKEKELTISEFLAQ